MIELHVSSEDLSINQAGESRENFANPRESNIMPSSSRFFQFEPPNERKKLRRENRKFDDGKISENLIGRVGQ